MAFETDKSKNFMRSCCKLALLLNILTMCFGIAYFIVPVNNFLYNIFGFILLCSWLLNIFLIYVVDKHLIKNNPKGTRINKFSYRFIVVFIIGILAIIIEVLFLNVIYEAVNLAELWLITAYIIISVWVAGIAFLGIYFSLLTYISLEERGVWRFD
jgi:hypothetical protein